MKRRIYVAIKLSGQLAEKITAWERGYKHLPVRWIAEKNLHITLVPPWQKDDIGEIIERLKLVSGLSPFDIFFDKISLGPNAREPRLIWAEGIAPKEINDLKQTIENFLNPVPLPSHPLRLHITLARTRREHPLDITTTFSMPMDWHDHVDGFVLMESHLSPAGSDYEMLATFPLNP
jgi:2'-5' RNA ligase